jgi:7-cyano-7-deazaguanine synthase
MIGKHVVVISGGMDSSTLLHRVVRYHGERHPEDGYVENVKAISFDYGQRHKKELRYAIAQCNDLGVEHTIADITSITSLLAVSGSSLVSDTEVPEGHYGEENMKATVVPNRNMIMSSIAAGYAVASGADSLWLGVHAGDHFIYPDCRPRFFNALNAAVVLGNEGFGSIPEQDPAAHPMDFVRTPFIEWTKADIAAEAIRLDVPLETTWSCYKGGEIHCGKCGTCVERLEAIYIAASEFPGYMDPTTYEDNTFWKEALQRDTV